LADTFERLNQKKKAQEYYDISLKMTQKILKEHVIISRIYKLKNTIQKA